MCQRCLLQARTGASPLGTQLQTGCGTPSSVSDRPRGTISGAGPATETSNSVEHGTFPYRSAIASILFLLLRSAMKTRTANVWAIVLAAGEGSRLRDLTTSPDGTAIPKQFCSLFGARSLLEDAIARAGSVVPAQHICTIVADQHRTLWSQNAGVRTLPARNVFAQPDNRGTAIGVLYSLLHVLNQDSDAQVVLVPADHYVEAESTLARSLRAAIDRLERSPSQVVLLGLEPEDADPELGYILPGAADPHGGYAVAQFIEKPSTAEAREIIAKGGLWNAFIVGASARTLLHLFLPRFATIVTEMQLLLGRYLTVPGGDWIPLIDFYERLPLLDFSRDILQDQTARLSVLPVPRCGWNDLGTPRRVGQTLRRAGSSRTTADSLPHPACLNLAVQYHRLEGLR
jgi:mannose-1-phosphate guanylyltransferase